MCRPKCWCPPAHKHVEFVAQKSQNMNFITLKAWKLSVRTLVLWSATTNTCIWSPGTPTTRKWQETESVPKLLFFQKVLVGQRKLI